MKNPVLYTQAHNICPSVHPCHLRHHFMNNSFSVETLTCKGMWTGPAESQFQPFQNDEESLDDYVVASDEPPKSVNYLVGILDEPYLTRVNDKVKCFIYQETPKGGYRLAQSADASCRGLVNVRKDGYRTLHLKPLKKGKLASF